MLRARLLSWPLLAVTLVLALSAWTGRSRLVRSSTTRTLADSIMPECPRSGEWSRVFRTWLDSGRISVAATGELALAGPHTDVPEFNDCQQLISESNGTARFISLFAVFASARLDELTADSLTLDVGTPIAEILTFDSTYAPLGIVPAKSGPGFNCLYLFRSRDPSGYDAVMFPVGKNERACAHTLPAAQRIAGTTLEVTQIRMAGAQRGDYPPVARWDWDSTSEEAYIGIKCRDAWCEVHSKRKTAFQGSRSYTLGGSGSRGRGGSGLHVNRRVVEIKGWYDEQRLAFPTVGSPGSGGSTTKLIPGNLVGTVTPDPHLGDDHGEPNTSRFNGFWVPVASVGINGPPGPYARKLNLTTSLTPPFQNAIYLCYSAPSIRRGSRAGSSVNPCLANAPRTPVCSPGTSPSGWWAMSKPAAGRPSYYCVTRRTHPGVIIPGIVRWRWAIADETLWIRCLDGCCEVDAGR